jgi:sigma-E factor negative regulatory protein RseA
LIDNFLRQAQAMTNTLENCERLSALADGQLSREAAKQTLDWLTHDADAQARWNTYHLVGEVMRSGDVSCPDREAAFMQRLSEALAREPAPALGVDAIKIEATQAHQQDLKAPKGLRNTAANDASFGWRLAGGFAALLAVVVVSWQGLGAGLVSGAGPQLAQVIVPTGQSLAALPLVTDSDVAPRMIRDPQLDAFLAAHKQFGGTSAFQKPSGFLSNAVFEGAAR